MGSVEWARRSTEGGLVTGYGGADDALSFAREGGGASCVSGACGVLPAARGSLPGMLGAHSAAWNARCWLRRSVLLTALGAAWDVRCWLRRAVLPGTLGAGYGARCYLGRSVLVTQLGAAGERAVTGCRTRPSLRVRPRVARLPVRLRWRTRARHRARRRRRRSTRSIGRSLQGAARTSGVGWGV